MLEHLNKIKNIKKKDLHNWIPMILLAFSIGAVLSLASIRYGLIGGVSDDNNVQGAAIAVSPTQTPKPTRTPLPTKTPSPTQYAQQTHPPTNSDPIINCPVRSLGDLKIKKSECERIVYCHFPNGVMIPVFEGENECRKKQQEYAQVIAGATNSVPPYTPSIEIPSLNLPVYNFDLPSMPEQSVFATSTPSPEEIDAATKERIKRCLEDAERQLYIDKNNCSVKFGGISSAGVACADTASINYFNITKNCR